MGLLRDNLTEAARILGHLTALETDLERAAALVGDCLIGGNKLLVCGNGGSAADAAHLATEFVCRYQQDRRPYPAIAFTDAGSTLTAIGNDYTFDQIFARQVRAFANPGDVLIVLSTSGKSPNVTLALQAAREIGMQSIALLGRDGGDCRDLADLQFIVPSDTTARIQEAHKILYHTLCEMIEPRLDR